MSSTKMVGHCALIDAIVVRNTTVNKLANREALLEMKLK